MVLKTKAKPRRFFWTNLLLQALGWETYHPNAFRVVDGDSLDLRLQNGDVRRIRCIGFDCPELGQAFGEAAHMRTRSLVKAGLVRIKVRGTDRYGRQLCDVRVSAGRLSTIMLREGLAHSDAASPFKRFIATISPRLCRRGLWKGSWMGLTAARPAEFRSSNPAYRD